MNYMEVMIFNCHIWKEKTNDYGQIQKMNLDKTIYHKDDLAKGCDKVI